RPRLAAAAVAAAGPLVLDLVADLVAGRELASTVIPAGAGMLSGILSPVHAGGLSRTGSGREGFGVKGTKKFGLAAGLVAVGSVALGLATLLVGFTNARPSRVGMCGRT